MRWPVRVNMRTIQSINNEQNPYQTLEEDKRIILQQTFMKYAAAISSYCLRLYCAYASAANRSSDPLLTNVSWPKLGDRKSVSGQFHPGKKALCLRLQHHPRAAGGGGSPNSEADWGATPRGWRSLCQMRRGGCRNRATWALEARALRSTICHDRIARMRVATPAVAMFATGVCGPKSQTASCCIGKA